MTKEPQVRKTSGSRHGLRLVIAIALCPLTIYVWLTDWNQPAWRSVFQIALTIILLAFGIYEFVLKEKRKLDA